MLLDVNVLEVMAVDTPDPTFDPLANMVTCPVCGREQPRSSMVPGPLVREATVERIHRDQPEWDPESWICQDDLHQYRMEYVRSMLDDKGGLSTAEREVIESLEVQDLLAENVNEQQDEKLTVGDRVADWISEFAGSWTFIGLAMLFLASWITINTVQLIGTPFDPYPFILLNLVLSSLAAFQAPIILMSQNRQEKKDRLQSEQDYQTNLKSELEVRHVQEKLDYLLGHQWQQLLELQELQAELIDELGPRSGNTSDEK